MGKNREGVMVMKIISKLCFESINFTIVSFVIFKNALCIKITIPFHNDVGMAYTLRVIIGSAALFN